jgi:hypothetical protein
MSGMSAEKVSWSWDAGRRHTGKQKVSNHKILAAIQHERDAIGKRRKLDDDAEGHGFLKSLLDSEKLCIQLRDSVIKSTGQVIKFQFN